LNRREGGTDFFPEQGKKALSTLTPTPHVQKLAKKGKGGGKKAETPPGEGKRKSLLSTEKKKECPWVKRGIREKEMGGGRQATSSSF